jgi:hypothetical protein
MKMKIFLSFIVILLPVLVAFKGAVDPLVLIHEGNLSDFASLNDLTATPHLKGDGWILASTPAETIDILRSKGFVVKIVDEDPWSEPYYLVSEKEGGYPSYLPASFREIAKVPEGAIVKGSHRDVVDLIESDLHVVMIAENAIPIAKEKSPRYGGKPRNWKGWESPIIDQVSDSTLTEWVTRLQDFRTRRSCTDSNIVAGDWIYDTFEQLGYTEVYFDSFPYPLGPCDIQRNIVAVKPGTMFSDKVIVIGGHYDSMTNPQSGCDPDTLAPGADDNASGTAVVLETARLLIDEETDLSLIFIAIAAEELGGYGSYHFAEESFNEGLDIRLMVNADMVANLTDNIWDVEVNVDSASVPYGELMIEIGTTHTDLIPLLTTPIAPVSDHYSFYLFGYNSIFVHEGDFSPHWHRCTDTVDNLHIPYFSNAAEMVVQTVFYSANMPDIPTGFRVVNVGDGSSLYLNWDPNSDPDLSGYNIYYGMQPGVYDSVKMVTASEDTLDNLVEGTIYYIALSASDLEGYESPLAGEAEVLASSRPYTPTRVISSSLDSMIFLEWEMNPGSPPFDNYNVYRWESEGDPDTVMLGSVPGTTAEFYDTVALPHILYGYYVTAIDNQLPPEESDPSEAVYGRLATRDMGVLVVDNTLDGTGGPFSPTDEDVDGFYSDVLRNYNVQGMWDLHDSLTTGRSLMDYDLGIYSVVMWHSDVRGSRTEESDTVAMRKYLEVGGDLWLSGWQLMALLTGSSVSYYEFGTDGFIPHYMGIDSALTTQTADQDFIAAEGLVEEFPTIHIDSEKVAPIGALYNTEVLLQPFSGSSPLYAYVSSDSAGSAYHGLPVAVTGSSNDYGLIVTDFPLFFMNQADVERLIDAGMDMFEEPSLVDEGDPARLPRAYYLYQNYPNPFNPITTINYDLPELPDGGLEVMLKVYDVRGRLVRILVDTPGNPGSYKVTWSGRDEGGNRVASGVYLYTIKAGDFVSTRKMMIVR